MIVINNSATSNYNEYKGQPTIIRVNENALHEILNNTSGYLSGQGTVLNPYILDPFMMVYRQDVENLTFGDYVFVSVNNSTSSFNLQITKATLEIINTDQTLVWDGLILDQSGLDIDSSEPRKLNYTDLSTLNSTRSGAAGEPDINSHRMFQFIPPTNPNTTIDVIGLLFKFSISVTFDFISASGQRIVFYGVIDPVVKVSSGGQQP